MKPMFSEEVVRELGYQKYWPEKSDWAIATAIGAFTCVVFIGVLWTALRLFGKV